MPDEQSKPRDSEDDQFHELVGFCITEWAYVDELIFNIFHQCIGPLKQCAIIYYRTPGLDMRLGLTDEIVKSVLPKPARKSGGHPDPLVKEWTSIETRLRDLLSVRRRIAHQPVTIQKKSLKKFGSLRSFALNEMTPNTSEAQGSQFTIYANEHERLREKEEGHQPLTVTDLDHHFIEVYNLRPKLYKFYLSLTSKLYAELSQQENQQNLETSMDHEKDDSK